MVISRRCFLGALGSASLVGLAGRPAAARQPFFELVAKPGIAGFLAPDPPEVPIWGYNGTVPGPMLRVRQGDRVHVRFTNELPEPTSIHWHGIRIENAMDGVTGLTQDPIEPGDTFDYIFTVPDAGTYWYHSHNRSWEQIDRGLYGALIVDEPEPLFDPQDDITLMLDDWRVSSSGRIDEDFGNLGDWSHGGRLGNWPTVNGQTQPVVPVRAGVPTRLRLVNAANARILELDLGSLGCDVIAYDGQTLNAPEKPAYHPFLLGPAQRMDVILTLDHPQDFALREVSGSPFELARFDVREGSPIAANPPQFTPNHLAEPNLDQAMTIDLHMEGGMMGGMVGAVVDGEYLEGEDLYRSRQIWAFNGVAGLAETPFFRTERGRSVVVRVINDTAFPHAMHVHGHHFKIIERSDSEIDLTPWRDTFLVGPSQTTTIAFVADNPGKWLFHCHMLEHQAAGMKTWFQVA